MCRMRSSPRNLQGLPPRCGVLTRVTSAMQVPLYDRVIVPFLRRYNLAPTYLQRIGIGLIVSPILIFTGYSLAIGGVSCLFLHAFVWVDALSMKEGPS